VADSWVGTRDGEELLTAISRCMSEQSGERVSLD
jgi:frataxin-like iron-binding protein CyaY